MFPIHITDHKNTIASIKYNCKKNKISLFMERRNLNPPKSNNTRIKHGKYALWAAGRYFIIKHVKQNFGTNLCKHE